MIYTSTYEEAYGEELDHLIYDFISYCWQSGVLNAEETFRLNQERQRFMQEIVRTKEQVASLVRKEAE